MAKTATKSREDWGQLMCFSIPERKGTREKLCRAITGGKTLIIQAGNHKFNVAISGYQFLTKTMSCGMKIFTGHLQGSAPEKILAVPGTPVVILIDYRGGGTLTLPRSISRFDT